MNDNPKEHYILNEYFRPSTLDGFICNSDMRSKIQKWIDEQNIPHLGLFSKKPGVGKTTLAKLLVKNIDCDYLYINAVDKRGMDDIREEILPFISSLSFKKGPKIVILDEVTSTLIASQTLLLNIIETYSNNARFILTGNYPERLIEPLHSRLEEYQLSSPSKKEIATHLDKLLSKKEIKYKVEDLVFLINSDYPDIRKMINNIQKYTKNSELILPKKIK